MVNSNWCSVRWAKYYLSEIIFILTKVRPHKMKFRILVEMKWYFPQLHWWVILWYLGVFQTSLSLGSILGVGEKERGEGVGTFILLKRRLIRDQCRKSDQVLLGYLFQSFTKNQEFLKETSQPKVNLERRTNPPPWWLLSPLPSPGWQTNIEIVDSDSPRSRTITLWDLTLKELYVCHGHMAPMRVYLREIVR